MILSVPQLESGSILARKAHKFLYSTLPPIFCFQPYDFRLVPEFCFKGNLCLLYSPQSLIITHDIIIMPGFEEDSDLMICFANSRRQHGIVWVPGRPFGLSWPGMTPRTTPVSYKATPGRVSRLSVPRASYETRCFCWGT